MGVLQSIIFAVNMLNIFTCVGEEPPPPPCDGDRRPFRPLPPLCHPHRAHNLGVAIRKERSEARAGAIATIGSHGGQHKILNLKLNLEIDG